MIMKHVINAPIANQVYYTTCALERKTIHLSHMSMNCKCMPWPQDGCISCWNITLFSHPETLEWKWPKLYVELDIFKAFVSGCLLESMAVEWLINFFVATRGRLSPLWTDLAIG